MRRMKYYKFLLFIAIVSMANISAYSQTTAGRLLIGGESKLGLSSMNVKKESDNDSQNLYKITSFNFAPQVAYTVINELAIGVQIPLDYSVENQEDDDKYIRRSIAIAPLIRYYFSRGYIKPYLQGITGLGYGRNTAEYSDGDEQTNKYQLFLYKLTGGLSVFFNDHISLDMGLSYLSNSTKSKNNNAENVRYISSGFQLAVGFTVAL